MSEPDPGRVQTIVDELIDDDDLDIAVRNAAHWICTLSDEVQDLALQLREATR